jgi:hypothetical protein
MTSRILSIISFCISVGWQPEKAIFLSGFGLGLENSLLTKGTALVCIAGSDSTLDTTRGFRLSTLSFCKEFEIELVLFLDDCYSVGRSKISHKS